MRHAFVLVLALSPAMLVIGESARAERNLPLSGFRSVQVQGGGSVEIRPGARLSVTLLEGNEAISDIRVERGGRLVVSACRRGCPDHYRLRVLVETPRALDVSVNGGGAIAYRSGFAPQPNLAAAIRGGGAIDTRQLAVGDFSAAISGGGAISTGNVRTLMAAINGGGTITYAGNPQISQAVTGGGVITRAR